MWKKSIKKNLKKLTILAYVFNGIAKKYSKEMSVAPEKLDALLYLIIYRNRLNNSKHVFSQLISSRCVITVLHTYRIKKNICMK